MLTAVHLGKDWQEKVKTWFNQPGRKHRRRIARQRKARLIAPNPTHKLRPIVRGMTNKYNNKIRLGRGFTTEELKKAGINSMPYAKSLGIAIDLRRKDTSAETQTLNVNRIKEYLAKMILYPRKKADKKPIIKEATEEQLKAPESKEQNVCKCIIPFPKEEPGYTFAAITDAMKKENIYKTQRTERKTANGFYRRMEERKKKLAAKKK
jgi:large subunit ribosomal protein L13e